MPFSIKPPLKGAHPECPGLVQHCADDSFSSDAELADEWQQLEHSQTAESGILAPSSGGPLPNNTSSTLP